MPAPVAATWRLHRHAQVGSRVHDSGLSHRTGHIAKAGQRDIRATMVEAAHTASRTHPHWQAELARLEPRLGRNKASMAVSRQFGALYSVLQSQLPGIEQPYQAIPLSGS